ncbi:putative membrane protein DUF2178 [Aneurinibacillus soli]|uniref:Uncharacterized protein n=1 Tax=Aneurinibacillus soli TaxID=1500254 RepID=A0A0U5AXV9_9BACL|nr:DUF2178 domain-containing protein [Aneurinibacillus soli]PYE62215.1 putative membrane protein DUF2178 [Aneurinibacillus soli]BAU28597.1 hypothetical protein CB4_02772 [Aneurinibacillus soli]
MKNRLTELYLVSLAILTMGIFESTTEGFYSGVIKLSVGAIFLVFAITSHVKYNINRKQLERELSKEYDERDDVIEGKAAHVTLKILMIAIFLMMFLSKWIAIPTNTALFIMLLFSSMISVLAKKYYNHVL